MPSANLGNVGSSATPSTSCFACSTGNILYVTSTPSGALTANATNLLIYVSSSYFTSYALNSITMTQSITNYTLNTTATYAPLSNITAGLGSKTFTGTSTAPIYTGMQFTFSNTVYTILSSSSVGSLYTISLDNTAGIFPGSLISNVKITINKMFIWFIFIENKQTPKRNMFFFFSNYNILFKKRHLVI